MAATVFSIPPALSKFLEHIPNENVLLACSSSENGKTIAEVYDLTGMGVLVAAFKMDSGEVGSLGVEKKGDVYQTKRGQAFYSLTLQRVRSTVFELSVFEVGLHGIGASVIAPVELICEVPNQ